MKIALFSALLFLFACSSVKTPSSKDLKSPCASAQGGPCSMRINPNSGLLIDLYA